MRDTSIRIFDTFLVHSFSDDPSILNDACWTLFSAAASMILACKLHSSHHQITAVSEGKLVREFDWRICFIESFLGIQYRGYSLLWKTNCNKNWRTYINIRNTSIFPRLFCSFVFWFNKAGWFACEKQSSRGRILRRYCTFNYFTINFILYICVDSSSLLFAPSTIAVAAIFLHVYLNYELMEILSSSDCRTSFSVQGKIYLFFVLIREKMSI